uniref:Uncharacterized protein n=1 Tax=Anguilla anguilla TaxID=7936 RepID=A0A0E9WHU9_ANGAN
MMQETDTTHLVNTNQNIAKASKINNLATVMQGTAFSRITGYKIRTGTD